MQEVLKVIIAREGDPDMIKRHFVSQRKGSTGNS